MHVPAICLCKESIHKYTESEAFLAPRASVDPVIAQHLVLIQKRMEDKITFIDTLIHAQWDITTLIYTQPPMHVGISWRLYPVTSIADIF